MSVTTATDELRGRFGAQLILPDDAGYDEARALHNAMIDKRPAVIVRCGSTGDIAGALQFARASNLAVAVRGGATIHVVFTGNHAGVVNDTATASSTTSDPNTGNNSGTGSVRFLRRGLRL